MIEKSDENLHAGDEIDETDIDPKALFKLTKDLKLGLKNLSPHQARFLCDHYYILQNNRIRADAQIRAMVSSKESHEILVWLSKNCRFLEEQMALALKHYAMSEYMGRWAMANIGIGGTLGAGLLSYLDFAPWECSHEDKHCTEKNPHGPECHRTEIQTAGHFWSFCGLVSAIKWEKGQKRPFCANAKVLCWKIGQSFVKQSGHKDCFFGKIYLERKDYERVKNDAGDYDQQALEKAEIYDKSTESYKWYSGQFPKGTYTQWLATPTAARAKLLENVRVGVGEGLNMLSPAHIEARSQRYAVKLFIAAYFEAGYRHLYKKEPPLPYIIAHSNGKHVHQIVFPKFDIQ